MRTGLSPHFTEVETEVLGSETTLLRSHNECVQIRYNLRMVERTGKEMAKAGNPGRMSYSLDQRGGGSEQDKEGRACASSGGVRRHQTPRSWLQVRGLTA